MAEIHGSPWDAPQMPAAPNAGPAPAPYGGPDLKPEPPGYDPAAMPLVDVAADIIHGYPGATIAGEQPWAHDPAAGPPDAPYYPGPLAPVNAAGDNDAGGRDDVAASVAQAVANATDRWHEFQGDLSGQGAKYGDLMTFPPIGEDPGAGVGNTLPTQAFYDPPREYGGQEGAPAYGGNIGNEPPPPGYQGAPQ